MPRFLLVLLMAGSMLLFGACSQSEQAHDHDHDHDHDHGDHAHVEHDHDHGSTMVASKLSSEPIEGGQEVELGCAGCIYELEDAEGCQTAVKVGDKVLMLSGFEIDAHKVGLCKSAKKAEIAGAVEGENFVASAVRFLPEAEAPAEAAEN
jgi:hypothetical protein